MSGAQTWGPCPDCFFSVSAHSSTHLPAAGLATACVTAGRPRHLGARLHGVLSLDPVQILPESRCLHRAKSSAVRVGWQEVPARVLMGPLLSELLGAHAAGHPLLDAGALQQAPPQLVVVVVGDKVRCASLAVPRLLDRACPPEADP